MTTDYSAVWDNKQTQQLVWALFSIESENDMKNFLRDVMTEKEIIEISLRLEAASMLMQGAKYTDIVSRTKLSSRTVARISDWMKNGCNGYAVVLKNDKHIHTLPAHAV